jgi:hypothetical protein
MRITPSSRYNDMPCSYVGTGCAYEDITGQRFDAPLPEGLTDTGRASLRCLNAYVRKHLKIKKKVYYTRAERIKLREFLAGNTERAVICVLGHAIYVNGKNYWSFFGNANDDVVCVWYIA